MKSLLRVGLTTTFCALVPAPLLAQPRTVPPAELPVSAPQRVPNVLPISEPLIQVESIDAATRKVTIREFHFGADRKPLPAEPITVRLAANAQIVRLDSNLSARDLRTSNLVTLANQKLPADPETPLPKFALTDEQGNTVPMPPGILRGMGFQYVSNALVEDFTVVTLAPQLVLRRGGVPLDPNPDAVFLRVPFFLGRSGKSLGTLTLAAAETGAATVATLRIADAAGLTFTRLTPAELRDIAPLHAAGKMYIKAEISNPADGKREITRMIVSEIQ